MTIWDLFEETLIAISANKVRSSLTILGIVIGISSVIAMVAIGEGAQNSVEEKIESAGSNLITVMPGMQKSIGYQASSSRGSSTTLTKEDSDAVAELELVRAVSPELSSRYQVVSKGKNTNTSIVGVSTSYPSVRNIETSEGNFISEQNEKIFSKVAVLGPTARDDLFGEGASDVVGKTVKINGMEFKIIGITETKGGSGMNNQDDMIYIPLSTAQKFLAGDNHLSSIYAEAYDSESMTALEEEITALLLKRHKITNAESADFRVMNQADMVETASSVTETFTILLAAVAGISLIVGGIGIMNMMLTTVTERTREIGLRKAIGAKKKDISIQFLAEAITLTFIGGVIGVILGWLVSFFVSYLDLVETSVSFYSVLIAFGVSAAIGITFGYYPARRASELNPIEALRYE
ncbi:MAG: ABC transporter permease [Candidatus Paceibacterota bacterium]